MMRAGDQFRGAEHYLSPGRMALLLGAPVALTIGAWIYLGVMIGDMSTIPGMSSMMMNPQGLNTVQFMGLFLMWSVMMSSMMLPTAAPMIVAYARMQAYDRRRGEGWRAVLAFAGGYILAWGAFSFVAAGLQGTMTELSAMSPMLMKTIWEPLSGVILVVAGVYQFLPLKRVCLKQCQSPTAFLSTRWRDGNRGALSMGWQHGLFCIGCCWALMGLLFVTGVMNTAGIIAIAGYVLIEKIMPGGKWFARSTGICLILAGMWALGAGFVLGT